METWTKNFIKYWQIWYSVDIIVELHLNDALSLFCLVGSRIYIFLQSLKKIINKAKFNVTNYDDTICNISWQGQVIASNLFCLNITIC